MISFNTRGCGDCLYHEQHGHEHACAAPVPKSARAINIDTVRRLHQGEFITVYVSVEEVMGGEKREDVNYCQCWKPMEEE